MNKALKMGSIEKVLKQFSPIHYTFLPMHILIFCKNVLCCMPKKFRTLNGKHKIPCSGQ